MRQGRCKRVRFANTKAVRHFNIFEEPQAVAEMADAAVDSTAPTELQQKGMKLLHKIRHLGTVIAEKVSLHGTIACRMEHWVKLTSASGREACNW